MNKKYLIGVFLGLLVVAVLLPLTATSAKNCATTNGVTYRDAEKLLPKVVNTTNNATIPVKTLDTKGAAIVQLNSEVNELTVDEAIEGIKKANRAGKKAIYLLLDSPGGSVFDGSRLIAAMGASRAPVYTVVTGIAASMAAIIAEYGKERYMLDRTTIMFHPASMQAFAQGEVDKVISRLSYGKRVIDKMDLHTAQRAGTTFEAFKARTEQELWDDAEDALSDHLIDAIVDLDFIKQSSPKGSTDNKVKQQIRNFTWE